MITMSNVEKGLGDITEMVRQSPHFFDINNYSVSSNLIYFLRHKSGLDAHSPAAGPFHLQGHQGRSGGRDPSEVDLQDERVHWALLLRLAHVRTSGNFLPLAHGLGKNLKCSTVGHRKPNVRKWENAKIGTFTSSDFRQKKHLKTKHFHSVFRHSKSWARFDKTISPLFNWGVWV